MQELITEIENAENIFRKYVKFYHALEKDCPKDFKFIMLINGWNNPFIALNELLKRIESNEALIKRECKKTGIKIQYKSRVKELRELLQEAGEISERV